MKSTLNAPKPCPAEVQKYLDNWQGLENYKLQEDALNKLFIDLSPNNSDISDVLLKCATLNDFYSTNIFAIYPVAKHIVGIKDIDKRLKEGDVTLVDEIKKITINDKVKNFYSFATKYCSHHNPQDFPIYDSYVDKILVQFNKVYHFANFKQSDLKEFEKFKNVLLAFQAFFGLQDYDLKQIDQYLWQLGKEVFPRYKKKVTKS